MSGRYGALALRRSYGSRAGAYKKRRRRYGSIAGQMRTSGYFGRYNQLGTERKFKDTDIDSYAIPNTGQLHTTGVQGAIAAGTGESERIGRKITLRSVHIRAALHKSAASSSGNTSDIVRIIVGIDTQCNGVGPTIAQVLQAATPNPFMQYNNLSNKGRFIILKDKIILMNCVGGAGNGTTNVFGEGHKFFKYDKKLNIPVNYDGVTGGISEIRDNVLFMIVSSNANNQTLIVLNNRVRYTDV